MPHQLDAFRWAKGRSAIALFHEMRLGKTLVAIRWAMTRPRAAKKLVVAPLGAHRGWREQLGLEGIVPVELVGTAAQRLAALEGGIEDDWFLINSQGLVERGHRTRGGKPKATPSGFSVLPWDLVILDESTGFRSPRAQVTQVALGYLSQARYRGILTGLPNPEGPEDFVTQMLFVSGSGQGGTFMGCRDFWQWRAKHMAAVGYDWVVKASSMRELRAEVDRRAHWMTRKQAGMGSMKVRETRTVELPAKVRREYLRAERDFECGGRITKNKLVAIGWMLRLAGGQFPDDSLRHDEKNKELAYLVKGELRREQFVVWARHTAEIEAAAAFLERQGVSCRVAHGGTRAKNRQTVEDFQGGKYRGLIAQQKCFMMGEDFSAASAAIYLSNYFDWEVRRQTEDRPIHPKKKEPVLLVDLVAEDTVDVDLMDALNDKKAEQQSFHSSFMSMVKARQASRRAA